MNNKGNYIVSLSRVTAWLAEQAEALGVEIYPGFAGSRLLYTGDGKGVKGVVTGDQGIGKDGQPSDSYEPGMEFHAKVTLLGEGAHGSLSKQAQTKFNLRDGVDPQTYGLGIKEVWKVRDEVYTPGKVVHTLGWPLDFKTYGGSWLYHMEDNMISMGLVVGLDYTNPYLSPYKEFQASHLAFPQILLLVEADPLVTANETPPVLQEPPRRRPEDRIWCSSFKRRWTTVDPQITLPRWSSDRLLCRFPECSEGQYRTEPPCQIIHLD